MISKDVAVLFSNKVLNALNCMSTKFGWRFSVHASTAVSLSQVKIFCSGLGTFILTITFGPRQSVPRVTADEVLAAAATQTVSVSRSHEYRDCKPHFQVKNSNLMITKIQETTTVPPGQSSQVKDLLLSYDHHGIDVNSQSRSRSCCEIVEFHT